MARIVGIGKQNFESIINTKAFYIDKTAFIKEWWENLDDVTLITRPRRFGKTLTLNMVETFFSVEYADKSELFEQSKKRIHRIGQNQNCFYYIMICKNSIEEAIYETLQKRKDFNDELFKEYENLESERGE